MRVRGHCRLLLPEAMKILCVFSLSTELMSITGLVYMDLRWARQYILDLNAFRNCCWSTDTPEANPEIENVSGLDTLQTCQTRG